jgi:hypothetical protein
MPYTAKVFRILIASPSDVQEEREQIVKIIQEWNDTNSFDRKIVLLPLRWETHSAPELGTRPQELINKDVVDHCDLAIGVFWTRLGSPTGIAESGTIEEIERVGNMGKIVMLYFSKVKIDPDQINLDQLKKLKDFKKKTYPNGLVEHYIDIVEFRTKLSRQLDQKIKALMVTESMELGDSRFDEIIRPEIKFLLVNPKDNISYESGALIKTKLITFLNNDKVPDYKSGKDKKHKSEKGKSEGVVISLNSDNKDYYREYLDYVKQINLFFPVNLFVCNPSPISIRDIYIEIKIVKNGKFNISAKKIQEPNKRSDNFWLSNSLSFNQSEGISISETELNYVITFSPEALQPKREIVTKDPFFIGTKESMTLQMDVRIYADCFSEPYDQVYSLNLDVEETNVDALSIIENINSSNNV